MRRTLRIGFTAAVLASVLLAGCSLPGSGGGGTGGSGAPSGPCGNALYPVVTGGTWSYQISGSLSDTFVRSINSVSATGFEDQDAFSGGVTRTGEWKCAAGALTALDPVGSTTATVQSSAQSSDFQTTAQTGVTLPASVSAGDAWTQSVSIAGTTVVRGVTANSTNDTSLSCTADGMESVTVPAGTFDAMKITCQNSVLIKVIMAGSTIDVPEVDFTSVNWYAPGVGLVKTAATGTGLDNTMVLTSYSIP